LPLPASFIDIIAIIDYYADITLRLFAAMTLRFRSRYAPARHFAIARHCTPFSPPPADCYTVFYVAVSFQDVDARHVRQPSRPLFHAHDRANYFDISSRPEVSEHDMPTRLLMLMLVVAEMPLFDGVTPPPAVFSTYTEAAYARAANPIRSSRGVRDAIKA